MTTNTEMSTNSRFPIDLEALSVVEFAGSVRPAIPDSNPDCLTMSATTSRSSDPLATIGLLAFFLRYGDMATVWAETPARRPAAAARWRVAITLVTYALRALRWQYLLAPIGPTRFCDRLPDHRHRVRRQLPAAGPAGEVLRPYLLARRERLPPTAAFATIILERLLDLVTVLLLFGVFVLLGRTRRRVAATRRTARGSRPAACWPRAGALAVWSCFSSLAGHPERLGRGWRCASSACCRRGSRAPSRGSSKPSRRAWP